MNEQDALRVREALDRINAHRSALGHDDPVEVEWFRRTKPGDAEWVGSLGQGYLLSPADVLAALPAPADEEERGFPRKPDGVSQETWDAVMNAAVVWSAPPASPDPGLLREALAEIVSDSLAATTEGTDWAEAPEPSDEPGSPYVLRLTNELIARGAALATGPSEVDTGRYSDD